MKTAVSFAVLISALLAFSNAQYGPRYPGLNPLFRSGFSGFNPYPSFGGIESRSAPTKFPSDAKAEARFFFTTLTLSLTTITTTIPTTSTTICTTSTAGIDKKWITLKI